MEAIAAKVPGLDLYQPRDWPHRRGDDVALSLHSFPLTGDSPGRRSHPCENCGQDCLCIHDNVLCWRCKGTSSPGPRACCWLPLDEPARCSVYLVAGPGLRSTAQMKAGSW